ncbi:MAG: sensory histidine kinase AtoS [Methanoregula sp. PtaU1.Bin051]|nr:MAG: sensory histidine kinase AtoS [Methanoregula sp. PtaU1.Bin051]
MAPRVLNLPEISKRNWDAIIVAASVSILLFTVYCLMTGITTVFMHLYYFPIILLCYHYHRKGFFYSMLLSVIYLTTVVFFEYPSITELASALLRFLTFSGVAAVTAYLSMILEQRQMEYRSLSEFNESIVTNANVWLTVLDANGTIVVWNRAAEEISGYTAGEVIGNNRIWKQLYPEPAYRKEITKTITGIIGQKKFFENFETTIRAKNGDRKIISWNTSAIPGQEEAPGRFVAIGIDITERRQAEEALRKSQLQLREAMDLAQLVHWEYDVPTGIFTFNDRFYAMYGTSAEREGGYRMPAEVYVKEFVHPDEKNLIAEEVSKAIATTDPDYFSRIEHRIIRRDGEVRHIVVRIAITKDALGRTIKTHGANQDVTERRKAEEAIRISEKKFRELFDNMSSGVAVYEAKNNGADFIIRDFNRAAEKIENINRHDIIGQSVREVFPGVEEFGLFDVFRKVWETGVPQQHPISLYKDERIAGWRDNYVYKLPSGEIVAIYDDVTERKKAEEELQRLYHKLEDRVKERTIELEQANAALVSEVSQRKLAEESLQRALSLLNAAIESTADGILVVDMEGRIASFNRQFTQMWKIPDSVLAARDDNMAINYVLSQLKDPDRFLSKVKELYSQPSNESFDTLEFLDGRIFERYSKPQVIGQSIVGRVWSFRDVTDQKRAERRLTESLKEKEMLLREVHHRVKNNLQIIVSLLNLQSRYIRDENVLSAIKDSQSRVRVMSLVHEKLYRSKDLSGINLEDYIGFLATSLFHFYGTNKSLVALSVDVKESLVDINTAIPLGLIINELVSNALKYAFPGGRKGEVRIATETEDNILTLTISDNGVGMPPEIDWKNTDSLGLQLVNSLVEQLDGSIDLIRKNGTTYIIRIQRQTVRGGTA